MVTASPSQSLLSRSGLLDFYPFSFSLFRVGLSVYIVWFVCLHHLSIYSAFYTDQGVFPRELLATHWPWPKYPSVLRLCDATWFHVSFWVIFFLAALTFGFGFKTRISTIVLTVLSVSLFWRNPVLQSYSHILLLLNLLLMWSCFIPLNRYMSVDAALDSSLRNKSYPKISLLAFKMQISSLYFFSGLYKLYGEKWVDGSAVATTLAGGAYANQPLGMWFVHNVPELLIIITYCTVFFQLIFSFLVYSPFYNIITRSIALIIAFTMHASFILFLKIGGFPYICFCYLVTLVPDDWWSYLFQRRRKRLKHVKIFYNPHYQLARKVSFLLREFCLPSSVPVIAGNNFIDSQLIPYQRQYLIIYDEGANVRHGWDAATYILTQSPVFFFLAWIIKLKGSRKVVTWLLYTKLEKQTTSEERVDLVYDNNKELSHSAFIQALCAIMATLAFASNVLQTPKINISDVHNNRSASYRQGISGIVLEMASYFQVRQSWGLFAPNPSSSSIAVDFYISESLGGISDSDKPLYPEALLQKNEHAPPEISSQWKKYAIINKYRDVNDAFFNYVCRQINKEKLFEKNYTVLKMRTTIRYSFGKSPESVFAYRCPSISAGAATKF